MSRPDESEAIVFQQIDDEGLSEAEQTSEEKSLEDWLEHLKAEHKDTRIAVHRQTEEGHRGKMPYLFSFTPQEYDFYTLNDKLRDVYKGGSFRLRAYKNGRLFINELMVVEAVEETILEKEAVKETDDNMLNMFNAMQKQLSQSSDKMMQMMLMVMGINGQNKGGENNSPNMMGDMLSNMALMKQLLGTNEPAVNPMEMMTTVVDLASKLNPSDNDKDSNNNDVFIKMLETLGTPLVEMTMKGLNKQPIQAQNPATPNQNLTTQKPTPINKPNIIEVMKAQSELLIQKAAKGSEPGLYVDLILDTIPISELHTFCQGDTFIALMGINPNIGKHQKWFVAFSDMMNQALLEESQGNVDLPETGEVELGDSESNPQEDGAVTIDQDGDGSNSIDAEDISTFA